MKKRYTSDPNQASRRNAFKNKNKNKRILLVLFAWLIGTPMMLAQTNWQPPVSGANTYYLRTKTPGSNNFEISTDGISYNGNYIKIYNRRNFSSGANLTLIFQNSETILFDGQFDINANNVSVTLQLGAECTAHSTDKPTLKITGTSGYSNQNVAFYLRDVNNSDPDNHKLIIKGLDPASPDNAPNNFNFDNNFVIDGNAPNMTLDNTNPWDPKVVADDTGERVAWGIFRIQQGTLQLKNVTVQNHCSYYANAGAIQVFNNTVDSGISVDIDHCKFYRLANNNNPVIRLQSKNGTYTIDDNRNVAFKNSEIMEIYDASIYKNSTTSINSNTQSTGCIRSFGNNKIKLSIDKCHIDKNFGCTVRWHGCGTFGPMTVSNCIIENNYTKTGTNVFGGGGLLLKGPATITNCIIRNNKTNGNGGGIYLSTYNDFNDGTIGYVPDHCILELDNTTIIESNQAQGNGGGIAIEGLRMRNTYGPLPYSNGPDGYIWYGPDGEPYTVKFILGGATISNNTAIGSYGGGVFITRNNEVTYYKLECELDKGTITNNTCASGSGGGVAIYTIAGASNPGVMPSTVHPQNVYVTISKEYESTDGIFLQNNSANLGGGVYVDATEVTYNGVTSNVNTNVYDYTEITSNTASTDGGGIYVKNGEVKIQQLGSTHQPTLQQNTATSGYGGGLYLNSGSIRMKGAIIGGYDTSTSTSLGNTAGVSGGGIFLESGDVLINPNEFETSQPTKIDHNVANLNGGGLSNRNGQVVIFGSFDASNTYPVEITNNEATTGSGGGIFCIGDASSTEYDIRMRRVKIEGNKAVSGTGTVDINGSTVDKGCGGGIYLQEGKISIINGKLNNNEANVSGGGVYTQSGNIDINPTREERQASEITNNTANINGGGLNTNSGKITVQGNNKDTRILITGNTANTGSGGGIFCMGGGGSMTDPYITLKHVDLKLNKALDDSGSAGTGVSAGCGGGMYLQLGEIDATDVTMQNNYAKVNGGAIYNHEGFVDIWGCLIGGTDYYDGTTSDGKGNKADNSGGGIYTNAGDIDIEDYVETASGINRYVSKITYNEAAMNGGGLNTHSGTITINDNQDDDLIEIAYNKAKKGGGMYANAGTINAYNALIHDNTATENGGGINNHSGDITLYGGMLSNNLAETGHGGGAYTNVGDIDLFQFPSTKLNNVTLDDGTKVYNNIALKNGGAFNNHTGRVDVRHATLYNNTATQGNGGAIFCEGPHAYANRGLGYTIRLLCSDMVQNKTRGQDGTETEPTGRGGGVYLKYGSIYAHYSNILNNEANIAGGGLDNHSGNIILYGCDIIGNRAIELDGGGIFTKEGNITTGPSQRRDGTLASKATVFQKNTAHNDGGGIYNEHGDITLNGDLIGGTTSDLGNIAQKGDGGGVYIANGTINMKGGKIAYNTANSGKGGGVYSGGGEFNIEKRDDNPLPITLIVDVEVKRVVGGQNATVHYHLVDQGKYGAGVSNVKHGIMWWDEETPGTKYKVIYNVTDSIGYGYDQGEPACQRITIPASAITAGKTYKVKSFFQYEYSSNTYTGFSDVMEFITYSNTLPTVISGTVSNITKNSAEGSGKIQDNGGSDITARGVQLWTGSSTPPGNPTGTLHASSDETDFFTVSLTSLSPNTTYYARAYATNGSGTAYGATVEFKTLKDTPDMGNGPLTVTTDINSVGQIVVTASYTMPSGTTFGTGPGEVQGYGFVWSTDDDPELYADHTIAGVLSSGTTTFTAQYVGAREGIAAYVRAYATYEESAVTSTSDPTNYSITKPKQFFTPYLNGDPVVRAIRLSNITQTSATITCKIYSGYNYGGATTVYGVHVENFSPYYFPHTTDYQPADSTYTVTLTGLTVNTTYYLKAYATNDGGATYSYGNGYNFTTLPVSLPNVTITSISDITKTTANINCKMTDGGGTVTDWGVKYSLNSDMSSSTDVNQPTITSNTFTGNLTGLTEHTTYYVQAYATNSAGTHTCPVVSFTTNYDKPTVNTLTITNSATPDGTNVNATANFKVAAHSANAIDEVKTYGVCWSIFHNPTRKQSEVSDTDFAETTGTPISSTTPQDCSNGMTQKFPNTRYWVRAYASTKEPDGSGNLTDTVYSSETSFITLPAMVTKTASNVGKTSATLSGQIASRDSEGYLVNGYYGVCWGTSANPTRTTGYYTEQKITAANASTFDFSLDASTNISASTEYHYRAYYRPASGNIAYGLDNTFTTKAYNLTVVASPAAGGTVSPTSAGMNNDETQSVTATANPGYTFSSWSFTGGGTDASISDPATTNPTTFTMGNPGDDATLTASFTANNYTLTVTADPVDGGTFTVNSTAYISPVSVAYNSAITLVATPASGKAFVNWTLNGNEVSTDATYTFTYETVGNAEYVAHFEDAGGGKSSSTSPSKGSGSSTFGKSRDIYPSFAREPWDWDDDEVVIARRNDEAIQIDNALDCRASLAMTQSVSSDTLVTEPDTLRLLREEANRDIEPQNIPMIDHNTAEYGGGIYMAESADPATSRARLVFSGGSSSAERGKIVFNSATEAGGGIYIDTTAHMWMKGHCEVNANNVPKNKDGAGVYLKGRLYVGKPGTGAGENGLIVNQNFAMDDFNEASYLANPTTYTENNKASLNNVCLTRHTYNYDHTLVSGTYDDESTVITLLSDITGFGAASNIGFHVTQGFCPVIATSTDFGDSYVMADNTHTPTSEPEYVNEGWLQNIMSTAVGTDGLFNSNGAIFEDTESYVAIHTRTTAGAPFNSKYIYLWGCWTHPAVKTDPEVNSPMSGQTGFCGHYKITNNDGGILTWEIYSEEGLAWFSAYVNGLNVFATGDGQHAVYDRTKNPFAKAILKNDLDLSAHFWVPIGTATVFHGSDISSGLDGSGSLFEDLTDATSPEPHHFSGSFDGQGHTIKGIDCRYLSGIYKLGLFGYLDEGAVVKNVFVDNSRFEASDNAKGFHIGGIAGKTIGTATVSASEARSTIDITNAKKSESFVGGLVGQTVGTSGHPTIIHSSMAMPEITGAVDYMGGLVGQLGGYDNLYNSFSNPKFNNDPDAGKYIGGLVGVNDGTVENCYARLQNTTDPARFGYLAGTNNSSNLKYCYAPFDKIDNGSAYIKDGNAPTGHGTYTATTRESGKYGFKHRDQQMTAAGSGATYITDKLNDSLIVGGLTNSLNAWVDAKNTSTKTYHPWMRTMASGINDDLPIPNFKVDDGSKALTPNPAYNAVGSKDGVYMDYVNNANDLLTEYAALTSGTPEIYLYNANELDGGSPAKPKPISVTNVGTTPQVKFFINEDVGITVIGDALTTGLNATVGVTFDNSDGGWLGGEPYDWHMFSPAIENAPLGLSYFTSTGGGYFTDYQTRNSQGYVTHVDWSDRNKIDPPKTKWNSTVAGTYSTGSIGTGIGYFPTDTPYGKSYCNGTPNNDSESFDFYTYYEPVCHWINFKREGNSTIMDHWRENQDENGYHWQINYMNDDPLVEGRGYMMAISQASMLMNTGKLNAGIVEPRVEYTSTLTDYDGMLKGINLIGNPYQSFLDFTEFASINQSNLVSGNTAVYSVIDADSSRYIHFVAGTSSNPDWYASRYIHPHQGFFVRVNGNSPKLTFNEDMRIAGTKEGLKSPFRDNMLNYPLVNLICYDQNNRVDITTVEINRPENGGGEKTKGLRTGDALIYARWDNTDYQVAFTPEGVSEVPVRFEAFDDQVFTIKWGTLHGDFHYLHLIDNLTGADVDMLRATEYRFEGRTTDYASRFKLVFNVTGIEEPDDPAPPLVATSFAFQFGDELIVTGEGTLQMFDLNGRCLLSTKAVGEQSSVSLPSVAAGMYLLRLTGNTETKVQKLIIK